MLNRIGEFVSKFFEQLKKLIDYLLNSLLYFISEVFYFLYDGLFEVIELLITSIDFLQLTALSSFSNWSNLPPQVLYVLNQLNFCQCLSILAIAYGIGLTLNLIPAAFTRV